MKTKFLALALVATILAAVFPAPTQAADPIPAPKTVTVSADELAVMIDAAVQKALDKRFSVQAGACATVDASACASADASACTSDTAGGRGQRFPLLHRLFHRRGGKAGGCGG
jgi:hypothetical protein